jgi:hypothetical protein
MPRRPKEKIDIDVVPYLSIMVIVLKLICLILIVTVMRIALNPLGRTVITFSQLYEVPEKKQTNAKGEAVMMKSPSYVECRSYGVAIFPGSIEVPAEEVGREGGPLDELLTRVEENKDMEYVILIVRPRSVHVYREVRKMLTFRGIDVGYDVLETETKIDWDKQTSKKAETSS